MNPCNACISCRSGIKYLYLDRSSYLGAKQSLFEGKMCEQLMNNDITSYLIHSICGMVQRSLLDRTNNCLKELAMLRGCSQTSHDMPSLSSTPDPPVNSRELQWHSLLLKQAQQNNRKKACNALTRFSGRPIFLFEHRFSSGYSTPSYYMEHFGSQRLFASRVAHFTASSQPIIIIEGCWHKTSIQGPSSSQLLTYQS